MQRAQSHWLPDGKRLHLHHGPIDMIIGIIGPGRRAGFSRAVSRFETLLDELVTELPRLRSNTGPAPAGETARQMHQATMPFAPRFITPMAAVAGAGADTILRAICAGPGIARAYVNNGGDVSFFLTTEQHMNAAIASDPPARLRIAHADPVRGVASSGWRGRSHSMGIADSVTVLAPTAAMADAAATMIANAVDLSRHPLVKRQPANTLAPDSDLGSLPVTTHVGPLCDADINAALDAGQTYAAQLRSRNLFHSAALMLQDQTRLLGPLPLIPNNQMESLNA